MKLLCITTLLILFLSSCSNSNEADEYLMFFKRYEKLSSQFDPALADMYSDSAVVSMRKVTPEGKRRKMKLDGKKWKELLRDIMPIARKRGDISTFTNVNVTLLSSGAIITATRYSELKCYEDNHFSQTIRRNPDGSLLIIEEKLESLIESACEDSEDSLEFLLELEEAKIRGHLPAMVDEGTQLYSILAGSDTLTYKYTLLDFSEDELDVRAFKSDIYQLLVQQTCNYPNLRKLVDKGALIKYVYRDKNLKQIASVNITDSDC